jgi:hypothetical protein
MKLLTRIALGATCLSVIVLLLTSGVTQFLETDGRWMFDIVRWYVPFYRTIELPDRAWWVFVRLWVFSLSIPPLPWIGVGIRTLFAKTKLQ